MLHFLISLLIEIIGRLYLSLCLYNITFYIYSCIITVNYHKEIIRVQALSHLTSTSFPVHWTCSNLIISTTDCPVLECMSLIISTSVSISVTAQAVHQMTGQASLVMALYVYNFHNQRTCLFSPYKISYQSNSCFFISVKSFWFSFPHCQCLVFTKEMLQFNFTP